MRELFLDKYRIDSSRKKGHDYTSPGMYYVTINTDAQINWFGNLNKGKITLSLIGKIVKEEWVKSEKIRDNIKLDEYIIMPNHIHGIIIIKYKIVETARRAVSTGAKNINGFVNTDKSTKINNKTKSTTIGIKSFEKQIRTSLLLSNSIGSIVGQFKSICTKRIRKEGFIYFKWQNRYYDHIIRSKNDLNKIRKYIMSNPLR